MQEDMTMEGIIGVEGANGGGPPGGLIKDGSEQDFANDVIQGSMERRSSSISGRPGAGPASSSGRLWKRPSPRRAARCAW